jgi:hypothetical protein
MRHLTAAVRQSVAGENWYGALAMALTLPDICASSESADGKTNGKRYAWWFDRFLLSTYTAAVGGQPYTFLTGDDCYALRCAFLHQGDFDVTDQRVRTVVSHFEFVPPVSGHVIHRNMRQGPGYTVLQLQVDVFAIDIVDGVDSWLHAIRSDVVIQGKLTQMAKINTGPAIGLVPPGHR